MVIYNPTLQDGNQLRAIPRYVEFQLHPRPGLWWFVVCNGFETGGAGLGISKFFSVIFVFFFSNLFQFILTFYFPLSIAGVQKPGGDQGIDPNALKSLVG